MDRNTFPLRRWLNVTLRGLHLIAVILLGAALLGAPVALGAATAGVAATGLAMLALDTWSRPAHLREMAGLSVLLKLGLVAWMAAAPESRFVLFWVVVVGSAVFAHAPAKFRHAVLIRRRSG